MGSSPAARRPQIGQPRTCRAKRLRHSGFGAPSQFEVRVRSSGHPESALSARTTVRAVWTCSFMRCTRTAAWRPDRPSAPARSARPSSPVSSSHHRARSDRSSLSSHRVASATSRRWSVSPSRRTVTAAKSDSGSGTSVAVSRSALRFCVVRRSCSWSRTWRTAIATSQERYAFGSRRSGRARTTRSRVSWTTSSTSLCPFRALPTML